MYAACRTWLLLVRPLPNKIRFNEKLLRPSCSIVDSVICTFCDVMSCISLLIITGTLELGVGLEGGLLAHMARFLQTTSDSGNFVRILKLSPLIHSCLLHQIETSPVQSYWLLSWLWSYRSTWWTEICKGHFALFLGHESKAKEYFPKYFVHIWVSWRSYVVPGPALPFAICAKTKLKQALRRQWFAGLRGEWTKGCSLWQWVMKKVIYSVHAIYWNAMKAKGNQCRSITGFWYIVMVAVGDRDHKVLGMRSFGEYTQQTIRELSRPYTSYEL
jgi:hypothetical protein